jgi:XisH protein
MARDIHHNSVREALVKDGWDITHDPYYLDIGDFSPMEIDLGAEKLISAARGNEKIVVEVKSFINRSLTYDFHGAYGQFRIYRRGVMQTDPERTLFLAMPKDVYDELSTRPFYVELIKEENIKLLIFNPITNIIVSWIN